jgi:DNA topoisomerase IA
VVELEMPEDIDKKKYGFWRLETLPIIPEKFGLKPIADSKDRYNQLKKLLHRKDIDTVINACDAGREGELIFQNLYQLSKSKLPVKRAWMQTMTTEGIREACKTLSEGEQMACLADAARSPQRERLVDRHQRHAGDHEADIRFARRQRRHGRSRPDSHSGDRLHARAGDS